MKTCVFVQTDRNAPCLLTKSLDNIEYTYYHNCRPCSYKHTVKQFSILLYENICCGYSFEMSTHNICFYRENQKIISHKHKKIRFQ